MSSLGYLVTTLIRYMGRTVIPPTCKRISTTSYRCPFPKKLKY
jgi:hypothetical protein